MKNIFSYLIPRLSLLCGLALSACDTMYGVTRTTSLETAPEMNCVHDVLESISSIQTLEKFKTEADQNLSVFYKGKEGSKIQGVIQVFRQGNKQVFQNSLRGLNEKPPQEYIDATRPVMKEIEAALGERCGMTELNSGIEEWCSDYLSCPPLD